MILAVSLWRILFVSIKGEHRTKSEEGRGGEEGRFRGAPDYLKKKKKHNRNRLVILKGKVTRRYSSQKLVIGAIWLYVRHSDRMLEVHRGISTLLCLYAYVLLVLY